MHNAEKFVTYDEKTFYERGDAPAPASCAYLYQWSDRKTYFNKQNIAWEDYTSSATSKIAPF